MHPVTPPYDPGLAYIFLAISTHILLKRFTFMSMCGMNQSLTSVRILLSLSHYYPIRTLALRTQTVPLSDLRRNPCLNRLRDV